MILLTWAAAALGLVFTRQFFHDVRRRMRAAWTVPILFCAAVIAFQVASMPEDAAILLLFKIVLVCAALSIIWFVWRYSRMENWWRHAVGQTIVTKDILLFAALAVTIVSLFFMFNRQTSHVAAWVDLGVFAAMSPVMLWRTEVWQRIHDNTGDEVRDPAAGAGAETPERRN